MGQRQQQYETNQELFDKFTRAKSLLEEAARDLNACSEITCSDDFIGPLLTTRMVVTQLRRLKLSTHLNPGQAVTRN